MSMEYKRLTEKTIGCFEYDLKDFKHKIDEFNDYDAFFAYSMAVKRLGELEDKIEAGTLIELPCVRKLNISGIECVEAVYIQHNGTVGECVCLNETEAEKKLEEIRNETKSIDSSDK